MPLTALDLAGPDVDLAGRGLTPIDMPLVAEALRTNPSITRLNLDRNVILNEGAQSLAQALKGNASLLELSLCYCGIENEGVTSLAEALRSNETLRHLDVGWNSVDGRGVGPMEKALLEGNVALTSLNVLPNLIWAKNACGGADTICADRNLIQIPRLVRTACLMLIGTRGGALEAKLGTLSHLHRDIRALIAKEVWTSRRSPIWIQALEETSRDFADHPMPEGYRSE